jgi:hypothetical protein
MGAVCTPAGAADRPLVAVIDGGVARTAELQDVLVGEYDLASDPPRPAFQPKFDHGTYVATVLHRAAKGAVDIVSLRIDSPTNCPDNLNPPCQPDGAPIAAAIDKAVALGADAINISLSLKSDPAIEQAVRAAAGKGVPVIMAAGNNGADRPANLAMAMAGYPNTILVGALDAFGEPWAKSNKPGPRSGVDYNFAWRPGVDIDTADASGAPAHASGTSLATPMETASVLVGSSPFKPAKKVQAAAAPVADAPAVGGDEVTTASAVGADEFGALDIGFLLHALCGFSLAVALYPLALAVDRARLRAARAA